MPGGGRAESGGTSILYDPKVRGIFFQIVILVLLVAFVWWIVGNTIDNLTRLGKKSGFEFFSDKSGFAIAPTLGTWVMSYVPGKSTYWDAFLVGLINTAILAFFGIIFATILGFIVGVARLSKNVVINGVATVYVEVLRNLPLLLQLFFWYFAALRSIPEKDQKWSLFETFHLNKTGYWGPAPVPYEGLWMTFAALLIAIVGAYFLARWARLRQAQTGEQFPVFWSSVGLIIGLPILVFLFTGRPLSWEHANFVTEGSKLKLGFEKGVGMVIIPEMIAMFVALVTYTASFIAEIVRAGILSVSHGQTEAAHALGLRNGQTLRLAIIPQALRVIIPPLTSQFLNLTKNSSLAVAIAYPELVSVFAGPVLQKTGQEIEILFITMMVYLTFSLGTAALMNWYNARIKLVER